MSSFDWTMNGIHRFIYRLGCTSANVFARPGQNKTIAYKDRKWSEGGQNVPRKSTDKKKWDLSLGMSLKVVLSGWNREKATKFTLGLERNYDNLRYEGWEATMFPRYVREKEKMWIHVHDKTSITTFLGRETCRMSVESCELDSSWSDFLREWQSA